MTELDKFKRRTIRSVARLLFKEKKPPEELWAQMKKETGTDCRVLWERMRALCLKKLHRMIAVDDRSANLPSIARLSLTDWLLVDLVLVHEKIDVIMMEKIDSKEYPALVELFNLVQRFDIEGKQGSQLAEAWAAATVFYNRQGRQCSPMLMQRRWYQLKKLTRGRFYKFWHAYRGNVRLLPEARKAMPTRLQMALAKRYPKVITGEFPDWEQLVENNLIIMPEEFEAKMRLPNLPKPCKSNDPDLVLVEPVIETIELAGDSDPEDHNEEHIEEFSDPEKSNDATDVTDSTNEEHTTNSKEASEINVQFQEQTEEQDGLSNVQVICATHVPEVEIPDDISEEERSVDLLPVKEENRVDDNPDAYKDDAMEIPSNVPAADDASESTDNTATAAELPREEINVTKSVTNNSAGDDEDDVIRVEIPSIVPNADVDLDLTDNNLEKTAEVSPKNDSDSNDVVTLNDSDEFDDMIKIKADEFCRKSTEEFPAEKDVPSGIDDLIKDRVDTFLQQPKEDISLIDKKPDVGTIDLANKSEDVTAIDLMADLNFVDDGIEFVDDGVEFIEEDDTQTIDSTEKESSDDRKDKEVEENNKFDLKLLMDPVVYTTKLDQMRIFTNKNINLVKNIEDIEMAVIESKPVSKKTFKINIKQDSVSSITDAAGNNDDLFTNNEEIDEGEEADDDIETVSSNSYMLKKPRTRSYDLIKLCKNPDFNTKLKRLTIGFLSSPRNRQLINACIPMTIDLSKTFESKLVNNTLHLKPSVTAPNLVKQEVIDKQASSIVPSAMPVQSLIDNSKGEIQNLISTPLAQPIVSERQKVINLPDIEKVRRINQQLLTAQVPPIRVFAGNSRQQRSSTSPATIPDELEVIKEAIEPEVSSSVADTVPNVESNNLVPGTLNTLPNLVKVKSEVIEDKKAVLDSEETIPPETLPAAKEKLIKIINQAKISTQEALVKIDSETKPDDFPKPIIVKDVKPKIPREITKKPWRQPHVSVAWAPRYGNAPQNLDDFLLTDDTLEKMLHLLMSGGKDGKGCSCCNVKMKKAQAKKGRKPKLRNEEKVQTETDNSESDQSNKNSEKPQIDEAPPKTPPSAPINIDDSPPQATAKIQVLARGRVVKYCCWAKQKLCNRKRITRHMCRPEECKCCCRDQLAAKLIQEEENKKKEMNKNLAIELSDDEESLRRACESIENVVKQSREISKNGRDETPDGKPAVIRSVSTMTDPILAATSNVSPCKVSVEVALSPTQPQVGPTIPTTPPKAPRVITKVVVAPENAMSMVSERRQEPRFKQVVKPRLAKPSQSVSCSCQKPALIQDSQRYIVIDGSKNCPFHPVPICPKPNIVQPPEPKQDKVLYLHSKSIAKTPSESPIFLGKNKILLTTVKFPRRQEEVAPQSDILQSPKIIPTLPLPAGVQLVLMPSGNVTYTLDQGVELDESQLASLPTIIAAVQEQLNSVGHPLPPIVDPQVSPAGANLQPVADPSQPVINIEETDFPQTGVNTFVETAEDPKSQNKLTTETCETGDPPLSLKTNEVFQDTQLPQGITNTEDMDVDAIDNTNTVVTTQAAGTLVIEDKVSNVTVNLRTLNDNNALSDEPVVSTEIPTVNETGLPNEIPTPDTSSLVENNEETKKPDDSEEINNKKNLLSDLMEMSGISAEDTSAPESSVLDPQHPSNVLINSDHARNLPELSPVTSFAELKYACEQNGKFFKLDFETGVIVPINVCIKKNPKNKLIPLKTKEFIDLTDDIDKPAKQTEQMTEVNTIAETSELKNPVEYFYNGKTVSVSNLVTPVKMFRAFRPAPTVLKRLKRVQPLEYLPINQQTHIEKRKQSLNKVEARIDLVDSDEPMEEEYLVDSSDDDSRSADEHMVIETLNMDTSDSSDDSSDDEPLAKKFKRLKEPASNKEDNIKETNIYDEIPDLPRLPDPSELTQSVINVGAMDTPLLSHDGKLKDLTPEMHKTSQLAHDPVPSVSVRNDLVPARVGSCDPVPSVSVRTDLIPAAVGEYAPVTSGSKGNDLVPTVNVRTGLDPGGASSPGFNDDDESDGDTPQLRFMSDHSNDGSGDEDCILGV